MKRERRCPTCHRRYRRSTGQNSRYWLLVHSVSERIMPGKFGIEAWHNYFKSRFLGCDEIRLPDKRVLVIPRSSADLDTKEFDDYMLQVEEWAAEHGVYLSDLESAA